MEGLGASWRGTDAAPRIVWQSRIQDLPWNSVLDPDFLGGREVLRTVKADGCDVNGLGTRCVLVRERCAAPSAEGTDDAGGRLKGRGCATDDREGARRKDRPRNRGRTTGETARVAMTERLSRGLAADSIPYGLAQAAAFNRCVHCLLPEGTPNTARASLRAAFWRLTFDMSGDQKAQPFGRPLDGGVRRTGTG